MRSLAALIALTAALRSHPLAAQPVPDAPPSEPEPPAATEPAPDASPSAAELPPATEPAPSPPDQRPDVLCARALTRVRTLVRQGAWFDTHAVAQAVRAICASVPGEVLLWDAVAIYRLDEPTRSKRLLLSLSTGDGPVARRAATVSAWLDWRRGDTRSFERSLERLSGERLARLRTLGAIEDPDRFRERARHLDKQLGPAALAAHARYRAASRTRRPWLAGSLSALLPGLGQAYAGSLEGAAVAFAINGILIGATVELARNELYLSATTTGMAASIFYVGNVLNAVDLARRRNETAAEPARQKLEQLLVPELVP